MKTNRVWIEIVLWGAATACALALVMASLGVVGAALDSFGATQTSPSPTEHTYDGMVTCSRCGAKHSAALGYTAEVCVRICVHGGAQFALVNADATYLLDGDVGVLKKLAGQRARVVGSLSGNTIRVASVTAATLMHRTS
jgi:hypothetical protein